MRGKERFSAPGKTLDLIMRFSAGNPGGVQQIRTADTRPSPAPPFSTTPEKSTMALTMKRLLGRMIQGLLAVLVVLYLGDWALLEVRAGGRPSSSVQVEQFLRTPLKGQKEEFDYMGTVAQPCVPSLFPHSSAAPCWWLKWHKIQWVSP
jgi:hypothetical protein